MARRIYEVRLRETYFPALSEQEAKDMADGATQSARLSDIDMVTELVVPEDSTMKLFTLCKSMYDLERFSYKEIWAAVKALAEEMGHRDIAEKLADMTTTWTERVSEDMTPSEFEEWLLG